jgi:proteasome assembly chaperone (PAC2) family protein
MEIIEHLDEVKLDRPILIAAFRGWNDAGDAASFAAAHLARVWDARKVATMDPEEFYDFQAVRPQVELDEGFTRRITWPANEFHAAHMAGDAHDVILLIGTEPSMRWRTFSRAIVEEAKTHDVRLVITMGALLADVPHSRPVQVTGTAVDDELIRRLKLQRSRYEGPTGIVGVLHDAFAREGIASASLWAAVPHYLAVSPNPKAALALVDKAVQLTGMAADVSDLERATHSYEERVRDVIAADEDVQAYVSLLEERLDEQGREEQIDPAQLPSGDALAAEVERYLREQDG